jgi:UDP-glucose 4-epimerase
MRVLVTGGAGFIGSHLCDRLIARGYEVWCIDNLYLGQMRNIAHLQRQPGFIFREIDVAETGALDALCEEARFDTIFHMAANSDIRAGSANLDLDLRLNFTTTLEVLRAMRKHDITRLFFASTSAVFGEAAFDRNELSGPLQPVSFYGASKLAAEAYISVLTHTFGKRAVILRFPNVVGERATHGAVFDFLRKLEADPGRLEVLGDGRQTKPYLYVSDLIDAILLTWDKSSEPLAVYHCAGKGETSVREIAELVVAAAGRPTTRIEYTGGDRGWPGDVPKFSYDSSKLKALDWTARYASTDAVREAIRRIQDNGF